MLAHTCERHLLNTCEQHLIPATDICEWRALSRTNRHTKVYNRVFWWRSSTERRWASVWHWELPKKKQVGSLYKRIVYSVGIPNNSHLLVLIQRFTKMGVLWLWSYWRCQLVRASENYTNGRSTVTGMGVPYEHQQAFVWAFSGNFTMTRTVFVYLHNYHLQ